MPMWPFGRKSRRRSQLKTDGPEPVAEEKRTVGIPYSTHNRNSVVDSFQGGRRSSRRRSKGGARLSTGGRAFGKEIDKTMSDDLSPISPTDTFSEKQLEKQPFAQGMRSNENITALPIQKELGTSPHLRPVATYDGEIPYNFGARSPSPTSTPSGRERSKLQKSQSRNKRSANNSALPSRKSSKRSKSDHVREEEIRAMSAPVAMPKRTDGYSGAVLRRDSKKMRSGLNKNLERPTSNISLPLEDSIHSSMSGNSEPRGYLVGSFDALAPRPTLRASIHLHYNMNQSSGWNSSRPETRNQKRPPPSREMMADKRTINELADDLDARDLRAVMERDARRREKKKQLQEERLRQKLERRAEKQRAKEQRREQKAAAATEPTAVASATADTEAGADRMDEDVQPVEPVGLGIGAEASFTQRENLPPSKTADVAASAGTHLRYSSTGRAPSDPLVSPEDADAGLPIVETEPEPTPLETQLEPEPTPLETPFEEPVIATAQAVRLSQASMSPPTSPAVHTRAPSNLSQMVSLTQEPALEAAETTEVAEPIEALAKPRPSYMQDERRDSDVSGVSGRRGSEASGGRRPSAWASWFRRGTATGTKKGIFDRGRTTPSEASFSNTSRESMPRHALPATLQQQQQQPRARSGTPVRTQSKFREDLPEMPISPPDSRVQSPELSASAAIAARRGYKNPAALQTEPSSSTPGNTFDEPLSHTRTDSSVSPAGRSALMSQSLGSVDSEGSWLSGKPSKLLGQSQRAPGRNSVGSGHMARQNPDFNASYEELGMPDDEFLKRLTPQPDENRSSLGQGAVQAPSSLATAMALRGEMDIAGNTRENSLELPRTDEETIVHKGVGRQPTLVHRDPSVRSTQGLFNEYESVIESAGSSSADDGSDDEGEDEERFYDASQERSSTDTQQEKDPVWVQRAKSVELGRNHARHLSAGSAKLLDIPSKRASVHMKTSSTGSASPAGSATPIVPHTPSMPSPTIE